MAKKASQNLDMNMTGRDVSASKAIRKVGKETSALGPKFAKSAESVTKFSGTVGQLGGPIGAATGKLQNLAGVAGTAGPLGLALAAAGGLIGGVSAAMVKLGTDAATAGDEMFDLARRFGVSVETMSRLKFVAEQSGASVDALGVAFRAVSRRATINTGEFKKWGVSIHDVNGQVRSTEELFFAAVRRINEFETAQEKTAAAMDIFGDSGAKMLQVIQLGEDGIRQLMQRSDELGQTISTTAAIAGNQFNNKLHEATTAAQGLKRSIGEELIPELEILARIATKVAVATRQLGEEQDSWVMKLSKQIAPLNWARQALHFVSDQLGITAEMTAETTATQDALKQQLDNTNVGLDAQIAKLHKAKTTTKAAGSEWKQFGAEMSAAINAQLAADEKAEGELKKLYAGREAWMKSHAEYRHNMAVQSTNEEAELYETALAERMRAEEESASRMQALNAAVATSIAQNMGNAFAQMALDSENAGQHMMRAVVDSAQTAVMSYAAAGAAASAAANAGIPGVGWIVATVAAGAMFGLIKGFLADIPAYASGGVVPGVDRGRDSVLAMVRPQERIFRPDHNERLVQAVEQMAGGGGFHFHQHAVIPDRSGEALRQARHMQRLEQRLNRNRRT